MNRKGEKACWKKRSKKEKSNGSNAGHVDKGKKRGFAISRILGSDQGGRVEGGACTMPRLKKLQSNPFLSEKEGARGGDREI